MLDWGRQRAIYFGGFVQDDWKITPQPHLESRPSLRTVHAAGGRARSRQPVQYSERPVCAARQEVATRRAIVDGDHNNFGPRAGFAWQAIAKLVLRGGDGLFYGERDQNQQVTQFSGNLPNVPVVSLPSVSATQTVAPPYTINTPIKVVPTDPSLASFTAANPFVGTIRTPGLSRRARSDAVPVQFRYSVSGDGLAAARDFLQRRARPRSLEPLHQRESDPVRAGVAGTQQAGQPPVPLHQRNGDPDVSPPRPTTTTPSTSAWRSDIRRDSPCW